MPEINPPKPIRLDKIQELCDPFPMREIEKPREYFKWVKWVWILIGLMVIDLFVEACVFIILFNPAIK